MKKLVLFAMTIFLISCSFNSGVKVSNGQVVLSMGQLSLDGNYYDLDLKVYKALKGKSGVYPVIMVHEVTDNYGNKSDESVTIGSIDADILNKYQDVSYWTGSTGGVSRMIRVQIMPK